MGKALIVDRFHSVLVGGLESKGLVCDVRPNLSDEEIIAILGDYEVLIVRSKTKVKQVMIDAGSQLKFIGRAGSGMENIDVEYAASKGIKCFNSPEGNKDAVAEQELGMLLGLLHNIAKADREMRGRNWYRKENTGVELSYQEVGILGYGNTGSAVCEKLSGFGCQLMVYDKYKTGFGKEGIEEVELETIFERADILLVHIPLTAETHQMINSDFINRFKKPIYLINAARGPIVKTIDVLTLLEAGKLLGLGLDVFENEKFATYNESEWKVFDQLASKSNVILTPHIAGWTTQSEYKIASILSDKIQQCM